MTAVGNRADVWISQSRAWANSGESMWSAYPRKAGERRATCGESGTGVRQPPRSRRHAYSIPTAPKVSSSATLPNCGCLRDPGAVRTSTRRPTRSEEHTSELQSRRDLVCRLLLEKKKKRICRVLLQKKKKKK